MNQFRQPTYGGPVRQPYPTRFLAPIDCYKIAALFTPQTREYIDRDGFLERHFCSMFLGINSSLLRLEFLSGFLPSFAIHE
jgi:hypothetical protein